MAHRLSCSIASEIFPEQGSKCPLNWQADSSPLGHQGSPKDFFFMWTIFKVLIEFVTILLLFLCFGFLA